MSILAKGDETNALFRLEAGVMRPRGSYSGKMLVESCAAQ
jgi:hypothetical protein